MKNIYRIAFSVSLSLFFFPGLITAQEKDNTKKSINQQQGLVVFDASHSYSLQNSTTIFKDILNPSPQTSFHTIKQEQDQLGFTHQKMQ